MIDVDFDMVVIGGGIAGASVAAQLSAHRRVAVLEMEEQPGYHSTGRSAAIFAETYGNAIIRALTRASRDFLFNPRADFTEDRLVTPRQIAIFGRAEKRAAFEAFVSRELPAANLELIGSDAALRLCPVLKPDGLIGAVVDSGSADIDVHALHQNYIRQLKRGGGQLVVGAPVYGIAYEAISQLWTITTPQRVFRAPILINAAGAWADQIASLAGVAQIGLQPRRRTAALIEVPDGLNASAWPMILDAEESFYMKPDAGMLLVSPADETLSQPEDAQADEIDVAIAADRVETLTTIEIRSIKSKWAGLRTFVSDRSPVVGFDPERPGFFWLAALGGYGIQTAPALSELAAKLALRFPTDDDFASLGFGSKEISPSRFNERGQAETNAEMLIGRQ